MLAIDNTKVKKRRYFTALNYRQNSAISTLYWRNFSLFGVKNENISKYFQTVNIPHI